MRSSTKLQTQYVREMYSEKNGGAILQESKLNSDCNEAFSQISIIQPKKVELMIVKNNDFLYKVEQGI